MSKLLLFQSITNGPLF